MVGIDTQMYKLINWKDGVDNVFVEKKRSLYTV